MSEQRPTVPLGRRLLFATITTALALVGVELVLRALDFGQRVVNVPDARVGHRIVPNQDRLMPLGHRVHINRHGMRDEDFPAEKPPGEYRVLLLGDSLLYGNDVEQEETFAHQLDRKLADACPGRRVRVLNAGVQGYDTTQERDWLETFGFGLDPDVVVVCFYPNDIEFNERRGEPWQFPGRDALRLAATFDFIERKYFQWQASRLGRSGEIDRLREQQLSTLHRKYVGLEAFDPNAPEEKKRIAIVERVLLEMAKRCADRGVTFAVVMIPSFVNTEDPSAPALQAGLKWSLDQKGVRFTLDLIHALKAHHEEIWLPHDPGHFSVAGHRLVAETLDLFFRATPQLLPCSP